MSEFRITMAQIAEACGVSKQAVSLALNGKPGVSAATSERIRAKAKELGYVPDPTLRSLVRYRMKERPRRGTDTIAYVHKLSSHPDRWHPFHKMLMQGMYKKAAELGYEVEVFRLHADMTEKQLNRILKYRGIRILLLAPQPGRDSVDLDAFDLDAFVPLGLGNTWEQTGLPVVAPFHFQSVQIALRHLEAMGVTRCGLLLDVRNHRRDHGQYLGGFTSAVSGHSTALVYSDPEQSRDNVHMWLEENRPDGILAVGPDLVRWSSVWVKRKGTAVPIASLDTVTLAPGHMGMDPQVAGIGETAVGVAHSRLQSGMFGCFDPGVEVMVPGVWVDG